VIFLCFFNAKFIVFIKILLFSKPDTTSNLKCLTLVKFGKSLVKNLMSYRSINQTKLRLESTVLNKNLIMYMYCNFGSVSL